MKPVSWLCNSLVDLRAFPTVARKRLGFELCKVQDGQLPDDSEPFSQAGIGIFEIRVRANGRKNQDNPK